MYEKFDHRLCIDLEEVEEVDDASKMEQDSGRQLSERVEIDPSDQSLYHDSKEEVKLRISQVLKSVNGFS